MNCSFAKKEKSVVNPVKESSRIIPGWDEQFAERNLMHKFSFNTSLTCGDFTNMSMLFLGKSMEVVGFGYLQHVFCTFQYSLQAWVSVLVSHLRPNQAPLGNQPRSAKSCLTHFLVRSGLFKWC